MTRSTFKELFNLHFNALCAFGRRYVSDGSIEDIVQDAFISFWQIRGNFENTKAIKGYLYQAVRNKSLNHIRDEMAKTKKLQNVIEEESTFESAVIEEETFNNLYSEIMDLPKASQSIMLLALNGLKNNEIADELDISINTVKTQKKIAYAKLKSRMSASLHSVLMTL